MRGIKIDYNLSNEENDKLMRFSDKYSRDGVTIMARGITGFLCPYTQQKWLDFEKETP